MATAGRVYRAEELAGYQLLLTDGTRLGGYAFIEFSILSSDHLNSRYLVELRTADEHDAKTAYVTYEFLQTYCKRVSNE